MNADVSKTHVARQHKHSSPLIACRFSPDGKQIIFAAQDYRIWRWEWSGDNKVEMIGHDSWVRGIAFSPDGSQFVSGGYDGRLVWWPVADPKPAPLRSIQAHDGWIRSVAYRADGKTLVTAGNDLLVKVWDATSGELVSSFPGHNSHVYYATYHPSANEILSGDLKGSFRHWDATTGKLLREFQLASMHKYDPTFKADIGGPHSMTFNVGGTQVACGGITNVTNAFAGVGNPIVVVVDWSTAKETVAHVSKKQVKGVAWGVAFHPDSFVIAATGGPDGGYLFFWKPGEKEEFHELKLPNTARDLSLSSDGLHVATAHFDGVLRVSRLGQ